jgi:hypothetical protein
MRWITAAVFRITSEMAFYEKFVTTVIDFEKSENFRETRKPDLLKSRARMLR